MCAKQANECAKDVAVEKYKVDVLISEVEAFNASNKIYKKRAFSLYPSALIISFTNHDGQARALACLYRWKCWSKHRCC